MKDELAQKLRVLKIDETISDTELRGRLRAILKDTHPDATKGGFQDKAQETRYRTCIEAFYILNGSKNRVGTELLAPSEAQNAVAKIHESILQLFEKQHEQTKLSDENQNIILTETKANTAIARDMHRAYAPLRFGGFGLAALALGIGLLNKPLGGLIEEIFAGNLLAIHYTKIALGLITLIGVVLGFYAQQRETRETERLKSIMTDAGIHFLLYRYEYIIFDDTREGELFLTLISLSNAVAKYARVSDRATCEVTADVILQKLLQRKFVKLKESRGLLPIYIVDRELMESMDSSVTWGFERPATFFDKIRHAFNKLSRRPSF